MIRRSGARILVTTSIVLSRVLHHSSLFRHQVGVFYEISFRHLPYMSQGNSTGSHYPSFANRFHLRIVVWRICVCARLYPLFIHLSVRLRTTTSGFIDFFARYLLTKFVTFGFHFRLSRWSLRCLFFCTVMPSTFDRILMLPPSE